jgi:hypothetical protein
MIWLETMKWNIPLGIALHTHTRDRELDTNWITRPLDFSAHQYLLTFLVFFPPQQRNWSWEWMGMPSRIHSSLIRGWWIDRPRRSLDHAAGSWRTVRISPGPVRQHSGLACLCARVSELIVRTARAPRGSPHHDAHASVPCRHVSLAVSAFGTARTCMP